MKLPNWENAYIPPPKLVDYLLSETHAVGRLKARFWRVIGFDETSVEMLERGLLAIGGGSIGLLLGERTGVRVILAIAGLSVVGLLLEILHRLNRQIGGLLKKLKEVKDA